jgi:membrane fusion protein (multidrug efflux system)
MRLTFAAIAMASLTACNQSTPSEVAETFAVIQPVAADAVYEQEYVANIHSVRYVEVRSRIAGYVERILVDEGQRVQEGQLLFVINSLEFEKEHQKALAAHKSALAEYRAAEVELNNVQLLSTRDIVSQAELDLAKARAEAMKAKVDEAKAQLDQAALNLEFTRIKAPYQGVLNRIPNKVGSLVDPGDMLTSISDNSEVFAYFNLSEKEYLNLKMNGQETRAQLVKLKLVNDSLYPTEGKIEISESEFDPLTGNIAFRARFANPDGILKHGSSGKVIISRHINKALMVPQKSTFEIQDRLYVFVMQPDSTLEQREIIPRMRLPHYYVLEQGLDGSEHIVYEGVQALRHGARIVPDVQHPQSPNLMSERR